VIIRLRNPIGIEGIGFNNIGSCFQKFCMNFF
jgi:hypothetical protein